MLTTDGFQVTCERERYANRLNAATSLSKPGSASTFGSSWVTSANIRLIGWPFASVRISSSPGHADHAGRGDATTGHRIGVRPVLDPERLVGLGGAGERVEPVVRPVVEDRLEGVAQRRRVEVLDVVELGLAVRVVVAPGEEVDVAVVVHRAEDGVEVHRAVEEVPRDVTLQRPQERVDAHHVAAGGPSDVGEVLVTGEGESPDRERLVALVVRRHQPRTSSCRSSSLRRSPVSTRLVARTSRSRSTVQRCQDRGSSGAGSRRGAHW